MRYCLAGMTFIVLQGQLLMVYLSKCDLLAGLQMETNEETAWRIQLAGLNPTLHRGTSMCEKAGDINTAFAVLHVTCWTHSPSRWQLHTASLVFLGFYSSILSFQCIACQRTISRSGCVCA